MGYIAHDATVFVAERDADLRAAIEVFRESLPPPFRPLLVGPVPTAINEQDVYALLPDGSKEWWSTSNEGDDHRARFVALLDGRDGVSVRFGGDFDADNGGPRTIAH